MSYKDYIKDKCNPFASRINTSQDEDEFEDFEEELSETVGVEDEIEPEGYGLFDDCEYHFVLFLM